MIYQISKNIDGDRMFIVNFSELNGRLDPSIYQPHFKFVSKKYANVKLSEIALIDPPCNFEKKGEVSFIPMDAIDATNGVITYQGTKKTEDTKGYTRFQEGDLLWAKITPCMQNGKSAIARNLINGFGCGSTEFFVIRPKNMDVVCVEYLFFLLRDERILRSAMNYFGGSAGQQRVSPIFLKNFNVPLPCLDVQMDVVRLFMKASTEKRLKEQQAETLLQSIDEYLLSELRINRVTDTRTENGRFFYTSHKEVTGKRLDPVAYSKQTQNIKQAIVNGKYSCSTLKSLITHEAAGDWGVDVIDNYDSQTYSKCLVLRSTEFNLHHNIVIDNTKAKYRLISNKKLDYIDLQPNDLIIEKSGGSENQPVGRVAIITKDLFECDRLCYSNFVQKIRLDKNQVIPTYACFFLRLVHNMKLTETMQSQTNGIRNLIMSEYYAQQIPLPPLEKQKEIITHIGTLCNRAKQLQQEATDIMTNAKQQIEQIILGE